MLWTLHRSEQRGNSIVTQTAAELQAPHKTILQRLQSYMDRKLTTDKFHHEIYFRSNYTHIQPLTRLAYAKKKASPLM